MRQLFIIRFTVEGSGEFPTDMLRYDSCVPVNESDARAIARRYDDSMDPLARRQVQVETRGRDRYWLPTEERWRSFTWRVVPGSLEYTKHV
jgi:hypothetical protein